MSKALKIIAGWAVPAFFGVGGTLWLTQFQNRFRYLDYEVYKSNIIEQSKQKIPNNKIKIIFENDDKNLIQTISQVGVRIYNLSDQDYENVTPYIEIIPKANTSKPLKIIPVEPIDGSPENIEKSKILPGSNPKAKRYDYKIKVLNRTENLEKPAFEVNYLIIGESADNIEVKPNLYKRNLHLRQFSKEDFYLRKNWVIYLLAKSPIILIFILESFLIWLGIKLSAKLANFILKCILERKDIKTIENTLIKDKVVLSRIQNQTITPVEIAEDIFNRNQERYRKHNEKVLLALKQKLYQPGEMEQLRQKSEPLSIAQYYSKTYKEAAWKIIPRWLRLLLPISKP